MAYTSLTQMTDRFGERMLISLTDRAYPATGALDLAVLNRALADADAMIDGYLAVRYSLPLAVVPPLVVDLAEAIAIYRLHVAAPDPKIDADYQGALKMLKDISRGELRLGVAGVEPSMPTGSGAMATDRDRDLTTANLKGFI